jgi:hypothetical protein
MSAKLGLTPMGKIAKPSNKKLNIGNAIKNSSKIASKLSSSSDSDSQDSEADDDLMPKASSSHKTRSLQQTNSRSSSDEDNEDENSTESSTTSDGEEKEEDNVKGRASEKRGVSSKNGTNDDPIITKQDLRLAKATQFLKDGKNFETLCQLLQQREYRGRKVSIRTLEWFVITYAEERDVSYELSNASASSGLFRVYKSYKEQLKAFSKKAFDPFCRGPKIVFKKRKLILETNLGQLNFFSWVINNKILDYLVEKYDRIKARKKKADKHRRSLKEKKTIDTPSSDTPEYYFAGDSENKMPTSRGKSRKKKRPEVVVRHFDKGLTLNFN